VNQVLREVVADALERVADIDDRLRLVTVTAVDTSPDLRHAVVYLSSLSDLMAEALADQRTFAVDPGVAHGSRVEEILRHLRADEGPAGADGP